jgi:hypothetical protein
MLAMKASKSDADEILARVLSYLSYGRLLSICTDALRVYFHSHAPAYINSECAKLAISSIRSGTQRIR